MLCAATIALLLNNAVPTMQFKSVFIFTNMSPFNPQESISKSYDDFLTQDWHFVCDTSYKKAKSAFDASSE